MKIVADSSVMFSIEEGAQHSLTVLPLSVTIGNKTWLEYEEISSEEFLNHVRKGETPKSSSPPPSFILKAYDTDEEIIHIAMADGLSGAYEVACSLKAQAKHPEKVQILNSKTLCIPHRILACRAVQLSKEKVSASEIVEALQKMIQTAHSYLIPEDFDFLRRGGRLTPIAAKIATLLKAVPVMQQTADGCHLERFTVARQFGKAVDSIIRDLKKRGVNDHFFISISHSDNFKQANAALRAIKESFPRCKKGIFELGPAFITQGGPGCIAIQIIDLESCPNLAFT